MRTSSIAIFAAVLASSASAFAFNVGFESLPNGDAVYQGLAISNQYQATEEMTFAYENGEFPVIAAVKDTYKSEVQSQADVGGKPFAFWGPPDDLNPDYTPNQGCESFFITHGFGSTPPPLDVLYSQPVAEAGGVILDIDYGDAWQIDAIDSGGNVLDSVQLTTSTPGAGDGLATPWDLAQQTNDISKIRITYIGTSPGGVGEAMDDFYATRIAPAHAPASVPLPPAAGMGLCAMGMRIVGNRIRRAVGR